MATKRFYALEKRLDRQPSLKQQYSDFIQEYLMLDHMELVNNKNANFDGYYLPHHAVIKETILTTKLRVVFDASARSSTGLSLNDVLMVGPTIQEDLFSVLERIDTF